MNYMENNQESGTTYNSIVKENLQVQNSNRVDNSIYNNEVSFLSVSSNDISADIFLDNLTPYMR
jgi:hypothetical protein